MKTLPVLNRPGGRSQMTCAYRCGSACSHDAPNSSDNEYFGDVLARAVDRRGFLKAGATATAAIALVRHLGTGTAAAASADGSSLTFAPVAPNTIDDVIVPNGYAYNVVARWGDPIFSDAPAFDFDHQTAAAQERQFGYNCDYVTFIDLHGGSDAGLLVVNHEYTNSELMFRDFDPESDDAEDLERIQVELAAHGMSVVEVRRRRGVGGYRLKRSSSYNRRVTAKTRIRLTGPAAGHDWLKTSEDPAGKTVLGTLNNCAGGTTPWGTVLSGEENFNQYFVNAAAVPDDSRKASYKRYGFSDGIPSSGHRGWERTERRFDLGQEPNEGFRFGWVVELDPFDPSSTPKKRTALGRMKHEGAEVSLTEDRRPVVYMGDDERFDYAYKFVGSMPMRAGKGESARRHNAKLLDHGTLYVAKFTGDGPGEIGGSGTMPSDGAFDGGGEWIPLVSGDQSFVDGMSAAEVLINTRLAADKVGATKMDRPEDFERNPVTGKVYLALTNNTRRGVDPNPGPDEANPRRDNKHGHIIEVTEAGNDPAATSFAWSIFMLAGGPEDSSTYFAGFDKSQVSPISAPDNLAFDPEGNLWIATDGNQLGTHDGFFATAVEGPERGHVKQFLTVPNGAEACGPMLTPDGKTIFCAVQHPGEEDGATPDDPASTWPDGDRPRPSVVSVYRDAPTGSRRIGT